MSTNNPITNYDDIIDSRDVIARIEELTSERDTWVEEAENPETGEYTPLGDSTADDWATEYPEQAAELEALNNLAEEAEGYAADWLYGEALIRESYFTEYAMDLLKDCGDLPAEISWYIEIDEEATARNILMDYTAVDFDGVTYYIR